MRDFMVRVMPFLVIGVMLVLLIIGIIFVSYVLLIGALVGMILFIAAWLREKFFPTKALAKRSKKPGRTLDHE